MYAMALFLGIDGGGSKTYCLIGDENSVLGSSLASGCNVVRAGEAKAREALASAIEQACKAAGITPSQVTRTCVGVAGAARPEIADLIRRVVSEIVSGKVIVVGDMEIALEAAFGNGPGVIVIAGTGSIAYGRNAQGKTARAGGWGHAVSDEGSGHWIGHAAVTAALRAFDKCDAADSPLLSGLMKALNAETHGQLVLKANTAPNFAALFPTVIAAADSGDPSARDVLDRSATELAALAEIVIRRLFPADITVLVAMSGGVFRNSAQVCQAFQQCLSAQCPRAVVQAEIVEPVRGALERARKGV